MGGRARSRPERGSGGYWMFLCCLDALQSPDSWIPFWSAVVVSEERNTREGGVRGF